MQVGTANFKDPGVSGRLVRELAEYCDARRTTVSALIGRAQRAGRAAADAGAEG